MTTPRSSAVFLWLLAIASLAACSNGKGTVAADDADPQGGSGEAAEAGGNAGQGKGNWMTGGTGGGATAAGGKGGNNKPEATPDAGSAPDARVPDTAPTPVGCTGTVFHDAFEDGDNHGWTHKALVAKLADPWVRGASQAPTCHEGGKCWTTGLSGPYAACVEGELASPVIDLGACASSAKLRVSFWQWQEIEGFAENRYFDGGFVQISKDAGVTWASLPTAAQLQPPYIGTSGVYDQCPAFLAPLSGQKIWADKINNTWKQAHFDLPADYITKQFRLRFVFGADIHDGGRGWIIDDFSIAVM